eukprot:TRINITY_DN4124_c0_g2_i2.p1 TRINITY_DN4124_c0_g2~~TRINITY_DN4124_c0_g2_i2.p1  ORF type:complete len:578 (-),score=82.63 TRINITY_DN4124_c0_g2_i2:510-2243(-)
MTSRAPEKLFDCLVVVTLKQEEKGETIVLKPTVKYHYPTPITNENTKTLITSVTEFCFPDLSRFASGSKKKMKNETFSFVLTEQSGDKRYGYCRRVAGSLMPSCFCILSFIPCFNIFAQILDNIITIGVDGLDSSGACTGFLGTIYNKPLPPPGGQLQVGPGAYFKRPNDSENLLGHVSFEPMLRNLDPSSILAVFSSLLVERRIIFTSDSLSTLSSTVQAFVACLYPFLWQHIFIPVLPQSLLSFCCAPMPFVVGILRSALPELENMRRTGAVEDVVYVDIDNNFVQSSFEDVELMPRPLTDPLMHMIETTSKLVKKGNLFGRKFKASNTASGLKKGELSKNDTQDYANAFIAFMADLLHGYRSHALPAGEKNIDLHQFINSKPQDYGPLLKLMGETQMFERFIQERLAANATITPETGKFEKRVSRYPAPAGNRPSKPLPARPPGSPAAVSSASEPTGSPLSGRKAPTSRFTMYDMGAISREDITKSLNESGDEHHAPPSKKVPPQQPNEISISLPDYTSFRKKTSEEEMMHGHFTGAAGSKTGGHHSHSDLPPPPAPPGSGSGSGRCCAWYFVG